MGITAVKHLKAGEYYKKRFGEKVYRISIDAGMTCPNRDGRLGTGGCIFCSGAGSGDFAGDRNISVREQFSREMGRILPKAPGCKKFIAYFQAYTNTYAPLEVLREKYTEAIQIPEVAALSIATRPDCLGEDVIGLLKEMNEIKPVWVELGLQTIHPATAEFIRRGFDLDCYDAAVKALKSAGIEIITHVILGLPGETADMMKATVEHVCGGGADGIKLQILQVLEGTGLADIYREKLFHIMTLEEYGDLLTKLMEVIPENVVIHRITGDPPKKLLIEPGWTADKKRVLNYLNIRLQDYFV